MADARVFDVPAAIGRVVWSAGSRERGSVIARGFAALVITLGVMFVWLGVVHGYGEGARGERIAPAELALAGVVWVVAFVIAAPIRYCRCLGDDGFSRSRRAYTVWTRREVVRFADVARVDVGYDRMVTGTIYQATVVTVTWRGNDGAILATQVDEFREEALASGVYDPEVPIDATRAETRPEARFAFAAIELFETYREREPAGMGRGTGMGTES